jgi:hypothetical protein
MQVRVQSKEATPLSGIEPVLTAIQERLQSEPEIWLKQLQTSPGSFVDLEKEVHLRFQQMADQMVAGLLAQATATADFTEAAKKKS